MNCYKQVRCLGGYPAAFVSLSGEHGVKVRSNGRLNFPKRREWLTLPLRDPYAPGNRCVACQPAQVLTDLNMNLKSDFSRRNVSGHSRANGAAAT